MRTALFIQCLSVHLPSTPGVAQPAVYYAYTLSLDLIPRLTPASSTTYHVQNAPYNGGESPPPVRCHECEPTADECERETKNVGVVPQKESMIVGQEGCSPYLPCLVNGFPKESINRSEERGRARLSLSANQVSRVSIPRCQYAAEKRKTLTDGGCGMAQKDPGPRDVVLWLPWCDGDCRCARPHRTRRTASPWKN
jgi:hypothetical protein